MNFEKAFKEYWPVIEAAKCLKADIIDPETGELNECSECVAGVIESLQVAEKRLLVRKEIETTEKEVFKI